MTNRIIIKRGSTRIFPEHFTSRRAALFLILFLVYELYIAVEAKSTARMNAFKNVTLVSKTGRYLTIGKQGITGQYSNSPYGKNISEIGIYRNKVIQLWQVIVCSLLYVYRFSIFIFIFIFINAFSFSCHLTPLSNHCDRIFQHSGFTNVLQIFEYLPKCLLPI